jgi:hypothetical protein
MTNRIFNFSAGPCTLPLAALEEARADFVDYQGAGMSLIEMSHRGKHYDEVHYEAMANIREVLNVPESHDVLFIQGGATMQFAMVPLNLMADGKTAEFINTGARQKILRGFPPETNMRPEMTPRMSIFVATKRSVELSIMSFRIRLKCPWSQTCLRISCREQSNGINSNLSLPVLRKI